MLDKIRIVGSGNVAHHFALALVENGFPIDLIVSRTVSKAALIASKIGAKASDNWNDLADSSLIICCTSDDSLAELIPKLSKFAPTISVSGTQNTLKIPHEKAVGVLYPLYSFSIGDPIKFDSIPLFIEAEDEELLSALKELANALSKTVVEMTHEQRQHIHIAAVFANNFTNHLLDLSEQYLKDHQLNSAWLQPIVQQTFHKTKSISAFKAQTGPAKRNDSKTIQHQLSLLDEPFKTIYEQLTSSIQKRHIKHEKL